MAAELQSVPKRQLFKVNVCRLCSLIRDKVLPIFDNAGSKVDLKLKECFPTVNIKKGDSKPQCICLDCITKLNMFNEFLQVIIESESKFDNYVKQYIEKESILKSVLQQNNCENLGACTRERNSPSTTDDGVLVLKKMDSVIKDNSALDFVLMIELKYKSGSETSQSPQDRSLSKSTRNFSELSNILDYNTSAGDSAESNSHYKDKAHQSTDLNRVTKDKKSYNCAVCGRSFSRKTRLNSHILRHTYIKPFKCDKCEKAFGTKWDLTTHKRVHTKEYTCAVCRKSFASGSKLSRHSRVHTGEKPFTCSGCGKSFSEKRNLENHTRTHTGLKPFPCTVCGKAFGVRSHLKDHLSVHNKTPRFNCALCNRSFKWKTNYNRHAKTHTTVDTQKNIN